MARTKGRTKALLQTTRLRDLLAELRALREAAEDGREKLRGEYVLDRQYVISLVDRLAEHLGRLAFDAHVLAPEGSGELLALRDRVRARGYDLLGAPGSDADEVGGDSERGHELTETHEYRLLAAVSEWVEQSGADGSPGVWQLAGALVDHVAAALSAGRAVSRAGQEADLLAGGKRNRFAIVDLDGAQQGAEEAPRDPVRRCRPLRAMAEAAGRPYDRVGEEAGEGPGERAEKRWLAVTTGDQLDLRSSGGQGTLLLEASLSGHRASDYVFLYAPEALPAARPAFEELASLGFTVEGTAGGTAGWRYDASPAELDEGLRALGRTLFAG